MNTVSLAGGQFEICKAGLINMYVVMMDQMTECDYNLNLSHCFGFQLQIQLFSLKKQK